MKDSTRGVLGIYLLDMKTGGIEKTVSLLIPIWVKLGCKIVLITRVPKQESEYKWEYDSECVVRECVQNDCLESIIKRHGIDIMIFNIWSDVGLFMDIQTCKAHNVKSIIYSHNHYSELGSMPARILCDLYKGYMAADMVLCLTEDTCELYRRLGINAKLILNPISDAYLGSTVADLLDETIVWVGRFSEEKKPSDMIEIMRLVAEKSDKAHLYMVGDNTGTKCAEETVRLCKKYGLNERVSFEGYQTDVDQYYEKASVYVMTSKYEASPNTLMESKAHGVPCVMYNLPYLVWSKNPRGMVLCDDGNYEAMAEEIVRLLADVDYRRRLGKEARESIAEYVKNDILAQWSEILDEAMKCAVAVDEGNNFHADMSGLVRETLDNMLCRSKEDYEYTVSCLQSTMEYRVGRVLLKIPRMIQKLLTGDK